jgi:hypothetical protein
MDSDLVALTSAAATALIKLLVTDGWQKIKTTLGVLWRRSRMSRSDAVEAELEQARTDIIEAYRTDPEQGRQVELGHIEEWQGRLRRLVVTNPDMVEHLRRWLDDELTPALTAAPDTGQKVTVVLDGRASGRGRVYQVGQGDQHINER